MIDNPQSDVDLLRIINMPARGIGDKTVDRLLQPASARGISVFDALGASASRPRS